MPRIQKDIRQEIAGLRHNQYFLAILVLLFVSIIVWTSVSIVTSQKETKVSPKLLQLAKPLSPSLKGEVIDELEAKRIFTDEELSQFPIYKILVSQDGRQKKVVTIDTIEEEIENFQPVRRNPSPSPSPTPAVQSPSASNSAGQFTPQQTQPANSL